MTPKEKAEEIIKRIFDAQDKDSKTLMICISTFEIALITVEEIVMALHDEGNRTPQYWYDVEMEIKKLRDN